MSRIDQLIDYICISPVATRNGHIDIVRLLLENGANVNIQNNWGDTALDIARNANNQEMLTLLKEFDDTCDTKPAKPI